MSLPASEPRSEPLPEPPYARPAPVRRPTRAARTGASPYDPGETPLSRTRRARRMARELAVIHPDAHCELDFTNAFELLVATVLSAQTTDKMVNKVTPTLFARYPDARALAGADRAELEEILKPTGFFRAKTNSVLGLSRALVERFDGEVPGRLADLVTLPGVGRKTANVVLNVAFGESTMAVDTHIFRLGNRTGLAPGKTPREVEDGLVRKCPPSMLRDAHHWLILHGRYICKARMPECWRCPAIAWCNHSAKVLTPPLR